MLIGVDVGTGSARAGVFDAKGRLLGLGKHPLALWQAPGDQVEQSSDQIWAAVCAAVHEAMAGLDPKQVKGIGFDATCSLVVVGPNGEGIPVGPSEDPARNVIVWMDHRAQPEAEEINALGHPVLDYVGGRISPEMETPKLLWLARHRPKAFAQAARFFDLPDFLTWRATGSLARSTCTVTCKWTYLSHESRWDPSYFRAIGLGALADEGFARIGTEMLTPGERVGGLTAQAAQELGLPEGLPAAAALIDAHAGGLGTLRAEVPGRHEPATARLAYIFGTSACSMASTVDPVNVPGVWGPYFGAMIPGLWLNEGGQSAAGAALDHLVHLHRDAAEIEEQAQTAGRSLIAHVAAHAETLAPTLSETIRAAGQVVVVPEFLGNRSPFADPEARAVISGLGLDRGLDSLAGLYLAGLSGIGYGLRQLIEALAQRGIAIDTIMASGGAAQSDLVCQIIADATGKVLALPEGAEPVLLGAAMLAATAGGTHANLQDAMAAMSGRARLFEPAGGDIAALHDKRYALFQALQSVARQQAFDPEP
ncbi:FGGY-family carbohydrate kinase [Tabrizicola sp. J26]|uniref:FGGY-family carbohydrate kinase n=1 Tax=Alitabrizicola rongguiensis TaxID=2909234 RepID=UPI001F324454|nr:FGGY-family carbohydrate kinase [Tabrizicola rongguiensis]MCF1710294.1 FGGY-family carbohydrate kinase [Tabrizicola rongguiensis]